MSQSKIEGKRKEKREGKEEEYCSIEIHCRNNCLSQPGIKQNQPEGQITTNQASPERQLGDTDTS